MSPYSDSLSLRLPYPVKLAAERKSLTHYTKGTQSPLHNGLSMTPTSSEPISSLRSFESRCALLESTQKPIVQGLPLFVCMRFQGLFHSPPGVLFAFPSRYWFTIGRSRVFSLGGWSPHVQTGFLVPRPTCRTPRPTSQFSSTGLSPSMAALSRAFY